MKVKNINTGQVCDLPDQLANQLINAKRFIKVDNKEQSPKQEEGKTKKIFNLFKK